MAIRPMTASRIREHAMRDRGNDLGVVAAGWGGEWWVSRFFVPFLRQQISAGRDGKPCLRS
jgi:hypothetical protein